METITRARTPRAAPEKKMLGAFLDYCRATLLLKVSGLSDEDLRRPMVPSGITLLGMVKHLAYVEIWWFRVVFAGEADPAPWSEDDPDADWRVEPDDTTTAILSLYQDAAARSRAIVEAAGLEDHARRPDRSDSTLRWIMLHMIEETARHNGHADIMREMIDGVTGE